MTLRIATIFRNLFYGRVKPSAYRRKLFNIIINGFLRFSLGRWLVMKYSAGVLSIRCQAWVKVYYLPGAGYLYYWPRCILGYTKPDMKSPRFWETRMQSVVERYYSVSLGDTVVEIGAGVGTETRILSHLVGEEGRVIAVEANPRVARLLRIVLALNNLTNVTVVETAVSDRDGTVEFIDEEQDVSGRLRTGSSRVDAMKRVIDVNCTTLDKIVGENSIERVALLKINIEGAEVAALKGGRETLSVTEHLVVSCHDFKAKRMGSDAFRTRNSVEAYLSGEGFDILPGLTMASAAINDTVFAQARVVPGIPIERTR